MVRPAWPDIMLGGEGVRQKDRGAGLTGPVRVEHGFVQSLARTVAAALGVVTNEDVEVPKSACAGGPRSPWPRCRAAAAGPAVVAWG
jgi:hypothetical protein